MHYTSTELSKDKVSDWMNSTVQHATRMEYYLHVLDIGRKDFERPHDIVGLGDKYGWSVISGLASGESKNSPIVQEALRIHRKQYHHRMWSNPYHTDAEDMLVGALDSICSLIENRQYQGGVHDWVGIINVAHKNPEHKKKWMLELIPELQKIKKPKVELITLDNLILENLAMPKYMKELIIGRTHEAVQQLKEEGRL